MGSLKFTDRRERKVCECVMIMVFYEKFNYGFDHFKAKLENKQEMLRVLKEHKQPPVEWQVKMVENIIRQQWWNYGTLVVVSKGAALISVWLKELLEKAHEI